MNKELLNEICTTIQELILKKNQDYGNSYFETRKEFGDIVFLVRIMDKVSRLKTLLKQNAKITEETQEDTIRDIVGYCLLELYYRKNKK